MTKQTIKQQEQTEGDLFITDLNTLSINSWDLLLNKETAINKYKRQQKELLKEIFRE
jgi:hypothetical protein